MMSVVTVLLSTSASLLLLVHHQYNTQPGSFEAYLWGTNMGFLFAYTAIYVCNSVTLILAVSSAQMQGELNSADVSLHRWVLDCVCTHFCHSFSRNLHQDSVNWSIGIRLVHIWSKELLTFEKHFQLDLELIIHRVELGLFRVLFSCEVRSKCSSASMFPCFLCLVMMVVL